ncbi:hypothetical protein H0H93_010990, partial [Arthromyces matolae]
MPVILKNRNISTELGLTNGAQGILRKFSTAVCSAGLTYFTGAIVEFPSSKAVLEDFPPIYVPIEPASWSFSHRIAMDADSDELSLQKLSRTQSQLHPAFAVTGQSAQGKTLPNVLGWLHYGSFYAYVTASRARSREGLVIVKKVTLDDLNKALERDLVIETRRHEVMEHNTLVRFGFKQGSLHEVPDPEGEKSYLASKHYNLRILQPDSAECNLSPSLKRMAENEEPARSKKQKLKSKASGKRKQPSDIENLPPSKRCRDNAISDEGQNLWPLIPYGCKWDNTNWSCAYDAMFMSFYCMFRQWGSEQRKDWMKTNIHTCALGKLFAGNPSTTSDFIVQRNRFRRYLHEVNSPAFPLTGPISISTTRIADYLLQTESVTTEVSYILTCPSCPFSTTANLALHHVGDTATSSLWMRYSKAVGDPAMPTTQAWMDIFMQAGKQNCDELCRQRMEGARNAHRDS